jgi:uncharacterized sulfatase
VGPVFHGPGEREYRWDAVNAPRAGVPVATRAAAALTQAREPFFVAVSLGSAPPVAAGRAATGEPGAELPAIAVAPLEPMARPHGVTRPRRLADSERQALRGRAGRAPHRARRAGGAQVLDALDRRGVSDRTVVVLVGDTSAPTGAHGALGRGDLLFEETLRVPARDREPGGVVAGCSRRRPRRAGRRLSDLLELCGLPAVAGVDGRSLGPLLADPAPPSARPPSPPWAARPADRAQPAHRPLALHGMAGRQRGAVRPRSGPARVHQPRRPRRSRLDGGDLRRLLAARERYAPAPASAPPADSASRGRLNVLFIIADDLNVHLGAYGYEVATPNIDRLAARGRRFDRAYAQVAMCSPSRSSLLSGWRPERTDVWNNLTPVGQHLQGARPLQAYFRDHGYFAGRIGKIYEGAVSDQFDWDIDDEKARPSEDGRRDDESVRGAWWVATNNDDAHEPDGRRARRVAELIEEHESGPFFLALGFSKPHLKWVAPKKYFDLYPPEKLQILPEPADDLQDIPAIAIKNRPQERPGVPLAGREPPGMIDDPKFRREAIAAYHASVSFIDAQVGVLMDTLDRLRLWDRTVVVLLGDHGFHLGEHHGLWRKDTLFEETLRTPVIIAAPQVLRRGEAARAEVELLDLYPTIVELAGLPRVAGLDGASLAPLLRDPAQRVRPGALSFRKAKAPPLGVSVRTARYRYTEWPDGSEELYDHATDPGETRNLVRDPAAAAALAELRALRAAGPAMAPAPEERTE